jgi:hypothetical protein
VQTEYVLVPKKKKQGDYEIGRRMTFERFGDFLLADFFEGLHSGHYPLRCGVCKRYFLQTTAHRRKYCDGYAPDDPKGRSCEAFAARSNRLAKECAADHHVKQIYNRRCGTINKHVERGKISKEQAIRLVIAETGLPLKRVLRLIEESEKFRYPETIDTNLSDFERAKRTPAEYSSPDYLVLQGMFWDAVFETLGGLRRRDYSLLLDVLGIDCPYCGRAHRKPFLGDIADKHQLRDEQSVTNRYNRIMDGIRAELERQGFIEG